MLQRGKHNNPYTDAFSKTFLKKNAGIDTKKMKLKVVGWDSFESSFGYRRTKTIEYLLYRFPDIEDREQLLDLLRSDDKENHVLAKQLIKGKRLS